MALTIQEQLHQGLFLDPPIGHQGPFTLAIEALTGDDKGMEERELDLLQWGVTFGAAFAIARQEDPWESTESVARRALEAARLAWLRFDGLMPSRSREDEGNGTQPLTAVD